MALDWYNLLPANPCNYGFKTTLIDFPMNVIYKGLQRSQISNVGLASTLTCLYGDISNHYALNLVSLLDGTWSVGWFSVTPLIISLDLFSNKVMKMVKSG